MAARDHARETDDLLDAFFATIERGDIDAVSDGRITAIFEYLDPAHVAAVFGSP